jgi:hypothetical protein
MANTINGIGTTYLGRANFEQDGSFVTTKWFVLGFFPIVPLGSARLRYEGTEGIPFFSRTSTFEVIEELPTDWLQVLKTWAYAVFIIAWTVWLLDGKFNPVIKIIFIAAAMALPHVLRWFAMRSAGAQGGADAEAALRREQVAERARQRAAAGAAPAQRPAQPAAPPASSTQATPGAAAARSQIAGAIASVKAAGLSGQAEGALLNVRVTDPRVSPSALQAGDAPVFRVSSGAFGVCYLLDAGDHYTYVNRAQLEAAGMTADELHQIGVRNLAAKVKPGLKLVQQEGFYGLAMGGQFEASLVLIDALWDGALKKYAPNGAVVSVAARDVCAFCDAQSAQGIAGLRGVAERITKGGDHTLTDKLFIRRDGKWHELDQAPPPSGSKLELAP